MGGGSYHTDTRTAQRSLGQQRTTTRAAFTHDSAAQAGRERAAHPDLNPHGRVRECRNSAGKSNATPIVVAMDTTASRGPDAIAIHRGMPSFMGLLTVTGVVTDPQVMICGVGDAIADRAPTQIGQFEADRRIDEMLQKVWLEEGGGGTGQESYELTAWYLANRTELDATREGRKGFCFFLGDEAPYPVVSRGQVSTWLGVEIPKDVPTARAFKDLQNKFHTYLIFPRTSVEDRKASIDAEMRKRLDEAGGQHRDTVLRFSGMWNTGDDLDIHCITPDGQEIYYGNKVISCGGNLDVDRNAGGIQTHKPVENIRWTSKDRPKAGQYQFFVKLYARHDTQGPIQFTTQVEVNGKVETIEGTITRVGEKQLIKTIEFTPGGETEKPTDNSAAYQDTVVLGAWEKYLPPSHILRVKDPANALEVMAGVMAFEQIGSVEAFLADLPGRASAEVVTDVTEALKPLSTGQTADVPAEAFE